MKYGLNPVKLPPARERVAASLRSAIVSRQIEPGVTLALETTARELGVSVTPVREAFQILARDGLIELKQNRGATVIGLTRQNLHDHYQLRAILESAAAGLCAEPGRDLSGIHAVADEARSLLEKGDTSSYAELNQRFHYETWCAAGNARMTSLLSELWNGLSTGVSTSIEQYAHTSYAEHEGIIAAMDAHDVGRASELMRKHIMRSLEDMLTRY